MRGDWLATRLARRVSVTTAAAAVLSLAACGTEDRGAATSESETHEETTSAKFGGAESAEGRGPESQGREGRSGRPLPDLGKGEVTWIADFETGDFSQWGERLQQKTRGRASIVTSPVREGKYAARFEVRPGDNRVAGSGRGERAQAWIGVTETDAHDGREQWWAWSTYFPDDFDSPSGNWNVFFGFHQSGDTGIGNLAFEVSDRKVINVRVAGGKVRSPKKRDFPIARLERGRWYDFVLHIKWSDDDTGFVEVWLDGRNVLPKTCTPTLYDDQSAYLKVGYYRDSYRRPSVVYHDGIRRFSMARSARGGPCVSERSTGVGSWTRKPLLLGAAGRIGG